MKLIALAAATLAIGGTAVAQDVPQNTTGQTTTTTTTSTTTTASAEGEDPRGGYMPAAPLFTSTPQPGAQVTFVPNTMTPTQAFPPPAPLESYPVCKAGQTDNCRQRGGRR